MTSRVIKDSVWDSPTLAKISWRADDAFPKWLLLADDWGCFNADPEVIKGRVYPKRKEVTKQIVESIKREYNEVGLLFLWRENDREWGFFVNFDAHHSYANKTNADNAGKFQKHRRKTPEPNPQMVSDYLAKFGTSSYGFVQDCTVRNKIRIPIPIPIPNTPLPPKGESAAISILNFLNAKTGKNFKPVRANIDLINARLKESNETEIRQVIALKCREWKGKLGREGQALEGYLRPATLFSARNFAQYQGELGATDKRDGGGQEHVAE